MRAQRNIDITADNMQALGVKKDTDGMYRCYGRFTEEYPVFIPRDGRTFDKTLSPEMFTWWCQHDHE